MIYCINFGFSMSEAMEKKLFTYTDFFLRQKHNAWLSKERQTPDVENFI
jgi:hypothetical protein